MNKKLFVLILIICFVFLFVGCSNKTLVTLDGEDYTKYSQKSYTSLEFFGTTTYMVLAQNFKDKAIVNKANELWDNVQSKLRLLDNLLNENIKTSDINKFNNLKAGNKLEIDFYTYDLLTKCKEIYNITNGRFNPSIGHLVDLWGFTPRFESDNYHPQMPYDRENFKTELPSQIYIEAFNKLTNFDDLKLEKEGDLYFVEKPNNTVCVNNVEYTMKISLGGIGKGYATDIVNKLIKEDFNFGYVSIGGSSISINKSIKQFGEEPLLWKVGIAHPREEIDRYMNLYLVDESLSTSGDYERFYDLNGTRYCHIINKDGYPISTNIMTATVVGNNSAMCDGLSTAICCMNINEAIDFLNSNYVKDNHLKIYFLYNNGKDINLYCNDKYELIDNKIIEIKGNNV